MGCIGNLEAGGWLMTNDRPRSSRPLTQRSQSWVVAVVLWLNGLSPDLWRSSFDSTVSVLSAGSAWVGWPATGEVFKQLMFECLMLDWVRGAWVVHVGVLNLPRIQAFSKPALWHFAFRLLKLIQKIERLCVCSLLLIPCHSNSSCLAERPFCFTFFSGSRCAPPYVPQHLASAGRTAAHPSCRWNYHHPRRVGTSFVDLPWNFSWVCGVAICLRTTAWIDIHNHVS